MQFEFQAVNITQVEKVFGGLKESLGIGTDGIAKYFLKIALHVIGEPPCNTFNLSLVTGAFPDCWKITRVAHIFKSGTVFINLKKAFDTVDHDILLQKLEKHGVIGLEHTSFSSYLKNRRQLRGVNGVASDMEEIKCEVPKSSGIRPLSFLIYINDLTFSLKNSDVTMYADDTGLSYSSKDIDELNETLNSDLDSLKQ